MTYLQVLRALARSHGFRGGRVHELDVAAVVAGQEAAVPAHGRDLEKHGERVTSRKSRICVYKCTLLHIHSLRFDTT